MSEKRTHEPGSAHTSRLQTTPLPLSFTQGALSATLPDHPSSAGRYRLIGEIGRGGMGEVWRAHDPHLDRPLAVKMLLERLADRVDLERRFLEEARITEQLRHPGITPVHEIGRLDDGRPFMAMKLIEGRTLDSLLKERVTASAELPRFIAIFQHICRAVGYAHSRGIIHRDLKPANVMVSASGEVRVMDWGLAKSLASQDRKSSVECSGTFVPGSPVDGTHIGAILGTPAYMAPEQARGETDRLDERCDVFGLGAILCVILTGESPFRGDTTVESQEQASQGNLADAFARLDACFAAEELVRLARRCLDPNPENRPLDANAVALVVDECKASVEA
jgi:eukaryotic-like serine/threonine-protein kinase